MENIHQQIISLNNSEVFKKIKLYYEKPFLSILDVARAEDVHSNFLQWLFSPNESHGLDDFALRRLLELIVLVKNNLEQPKDNFKFFNDDIEDAITLGRYLNDKNKDRYSLANIECERELHFNSIGEYAKGFIDLFISFDFIYNSNDKKKFNIIFENKVGSEEHDSQTQKYYNYGETLEGEKIYLYLTPLSNFEYEELKEPKCDCKKFIRLNYQYLLDRVLELCRLQCETDAKLFIKEYIRSLGRSSFEKGEIIMAVPQEERKLIERFWNENSDLWFSVFEVLADKDSPIPDEDKRAIEVATEAAKKEKTEKKTDIVKGFIKEKFETAKNQNAEFLEISCKQLSGEITRERDLKIHPSIISRAMASFLCRDYDYEITDVPAETFEERTRKMDEMKKEENKKKLTEANGIEKLRELGIPLFGPNLTIKYYLTKENTV